jgi:hypothetical protein
VAGRIVLLIIGKAITDSIIGGYDLKKSYPIKVSNYDHRSDVKFSIYCNASIDREFN